MRSLSMQLAVVARFSTNGEAGVAMSALDAAGIEAVIADNVIIAMDWRYSNAVGGVKLLVRGDDLEEAADVLSLTAEEPAATDVGELAAAASDATTVEPETTDAREDAVCPTCGSEEAARIPRAVLFVLLSTVLGGVALAAGQKDLAVAGVLAAAFIVALMPSHRCTQCGERWNSHDRGQRTGQRAAPDVAGTEEALLMEPVATEGVLASVDVFCPACGSKEAAQTPRLMLFVFISVVLGGVGLAVGQSELAVAAVVAAAFIVAFLPSHRCTKCGERWNAEASDRTNCAPPPDIRDTIEERCPRCGSANFHHVDHRRLKAITLMIPLIILVVLLVWPFLPKKHCDDCGNDV
jgi:ssDNA-binding Zn-finger/Zn-ribbon topoisomerase 1